MPRSVVDLLKAVAIAITSATMVVIALAIAFKEADHRINANKEAIIVAATTTAVVVDGVHSPSAASIHKAIIPGSIAS